MTRNNVTRLSLSLFLLMASTAVSAEAPSQADNNPVQTEKKPGLTTAQNAFLSNTKVHVAKRAPTHRAKFLPVDLFSRAPNRNHLNFVEEERQVTQEESAEAEAPRAHKASPQKPRQQAQKAKKAQVLRWRNTSPGKFDFISGQHADPQHSETLLSLLLSSPIPLAQWIHGTELPLANARSKAIAATQIASVQQPIEQGKEIETTRSTATSTPVPSPRHEAGPGAQEKETYEEWLWRVQTTFDWSQDGLPKDQSYSPAATKIQALVRGQQGRQAVADRRQAEEAEQQRRAAWLNQRAQDGQQELENDFNDFARQAEAEAEQEKRWADADTEVQLQVQHRKKEHRAQAVAARQAKRDAAEARRQRNLQRFERGIETPNNPPRGEEERIELPAALDLAQCAKAVDAALLNRERDRVIARRQAEAGQNAYPTIYPPVPPAPQGHVDTPSQAILDEQQRLYDAAFRPEVDHIIRNNPGYSEEWYALWAFEDQNNLPRKGWEKVERSAQKKTLFQNLKRLADQEAAALGNVPENITTQIDQMCDAFRTFNIAPESILKLYRDQAQQRQAKKTSDATKIQALVRGRNVRKEVAKEERRANNLASLKIDAAQFRDDDRDAQQRKAEERRELLAPLDRGLALPPDKAVDEQFFENARDEARLNRQEAAAEKAKLEEIEQYKKDTEGRWKVCLGKALFEHEKLRRNDQTDSQAFQDNLQHLNNLEKETHRPQSTQEWLDQTVTNFDQLLTEAFRAETARIADGKKAPSAERKRLNEYHSMYGLNPMEWIHRYDPDEANKFFNDLLQPLVATEQAALLQRKIADKDLETYRSERGTPRVEGDAQRRALEKATDQARECLKRIQPQIGSRLDALRGLGFDPVEALKGYREAAYLLAGETHFQEQGNKKKVTSAFAKWREYLEAVKEEAAATIQRVWRGKVVQKQASALTPEPPKIEELDSPAGTPPPATPARGSVASSGGGSRPNIEAAQNALNAFKERHDIDPNGRGAENLNEQDRSELKRLKNALKKAQKRSSTPGTAGSPLRGQSLDFGHEEEPIASGSGDRRSPRASGSPASSAEEVSTADRAPSPDNTDALPHPFLTNGSAAAEEPHTAPSPARSVSSWTAATGSPALEIQRSNSAPAMREPSPTTGTLTYWKNGSTTGARVTQKNSTLTVETMPRPAPTGKTAEDKLWENHKHRLSAIGITQDNLDDFLD